MQNYDDTGTDQYLAVKERFQFTQIRKVKLAEQLQEQIPDSREIRVFEEGKEFSIDSIDVVPMPVDHSIPGVDAFILHTSSGSMQIQVIYDFMEDVQMILKNL